MNEFDIEETKKDINNFLWSTLPPTTSMREAEDISITILRLMERAWDGHFKRTADCKGE